MRLFFPNFTDFSALCNRLVPTSKWWLQKSSIKSKWTNLQPIISFGTNRKVEMNKVNNIPHHDICKYMKPSIMTPTTKFRIQKKRITIFLDFCLNKNQCLFRIFLIHKDLDNLRKRKISIKIPKISLFLASCAKHYQEWLNVRILVPKPKFH